MLRCSSVAVSCSFVLFMLGLCVFASCPPRCHPLLSPPSHGILYSIIHGGTMSQRPSSGRKAVKNGTKSLNLSICCENRV